MAAWSGRVTGLIAVLASTGAARADEEQSAIPPGQEALIAEIRGWGYPVERLR